MVTLMDHNSIMVPGVDSVDIPRELPETVKAGEREALTLAEVSVDDVWVHLHGVDGLDKKHSARHHITARRSRCLAIIRRWPSPPVSHRQEIIVQTPSKRSGAAATNCPYAAEPRPGVRQGGEAALMCACTSCASTLPP